jgi:Ca2+-dependent lipid-binding protein
MVSCQDTVHIYLSIQDHHPWSVVKAIGLSHSQDPKAFVKFRVGSFSRRTRTSSRTKDPVWNEEFQVYVGLQCFPTRVLICSSSTANDLSSTLSLQVYHYSPFRHICIGVLEIKLLQLMSLAKASRG